MSFAKIEVDRFECKPLGQDREDVKQAHVQKLQPGEGSCRIEVYPCPVDKHDDKVERESCLA